MKKAIRHLYFWVVLAIFCGVVLGYVAPEIAIKLKFLGDIFIDLIKLFIAPIVFCTVTLGIAGAGGMKKVGRVGLKALIYFEVLSTVALIVGLIVVNIIKPGRGFNADPKLLDTSQVAVFEKTATSGHFFSLGYLIYVLMVAILVGFGLSMLMHSRFRERTVIVKKILEKILEFLFRALRYVMYLAPFGAGGAMAFTIGKFGIHALLPLASLMGCFYLTCGIFVFLVLGGVARLTGFSIFRFLIYIRHELILVLGTSSSESALAQLIAKLENLGCPQAVVGLVVPAGYSFNLDGTNIYLTMAALFVAQALNVQLTLTQQLTILGVAMLTSKGASGVTGAGFVTLAATLTVVPDVPVAGLALILGVDRFMSEMRALTNVIGNGVATLAVSKWEGELAPAIDIESQRVWNRKK